MKCKLYFFCRLNIKWENVTGHSTWYEIEMCQTSGIQYGLNLPNISRLLSWHEPQIPPNVIWSMNVFYYNFYWNYIHTICCIAMKIGASQINHPEKPGYNKLCVVILLDVIIRNYFLTMVNNTNTQEQQPIMLNGVMLFLPSS